MSDKTDKELRSKFKAGFKHAKVGTPPMKSHGARVYSNAYEKGYSFGSLPDSEMTKEKLKEHQLDHWMQ